MNCSFLFLATALLLFAGWRCGNQAAGPAPPPPSEPDTTSHDFTWTTYTLGDGQSYLQDVYAVNDTDVWAVGEIYLKDSTGKLNREFNAAHWDGKKWILSQIYTGGWIPTPLSVVFGFTSKDIWAGSTIPSKWDGIQWHHYGYSQGYHSDGFISRIWGNSPDNVYFVGVNGSITHYIPWIFQKMESGTTTDLLDISGVFKGKIYACGGELSSTVLEYDGTRWLKIDSLTNYGKSARWTVYADPDFLGFGGEGVIFIDRQYGDTLRKPPMEILEGKEVNGLPVGVVSIRGSSRKNVFAVGSWQYVIHYNGKSWKWYDELWDDSGHQQYAIAVTENTVFIVGQKNWRATILMGRRK